MYFCRTLNQDYFDRIHVGASCPEAKKEELFKLLAPNGILVTPMNDDLIKVTKDSHGHVKIEKVTSVRYGDLVVPSEAEIRTAQLAIEIKRITTITVPESTYVSDFGKLLNSNAMSDVTFIVENQKVYAHKIILSARSEHFRIMLNSGMKESKSCEIQVPNVSFLVFMECLKFIYTGEVSITVDNTVDLLAASNYFKLDRLKGLCEQMIKQDLDVENAAVILQLAQTHAAWQLKRVALDLILREHEKVIQTPGYKELEKDLLFEVITEASNQLRKD